MNAHYSAEADATREQLINDFKVAVADAEALLKATAGQGGEAVAAVSAGNTGALMALSMFILRKVEGVHRPALVASWPTRAT
mgnify:CR=1 FL=1